MDFVVIAFAASFAVVWLITYIPIHATIFGKSYSPRLFFCKFLVPMDVSLTLVLIMGGWIGISTAATGIGMICYNVFTGIGISLAVMAVRKFLIPRWTKKFEELSEEHKLQKVKAK